MTERPLDLAPGRLAAENVPEQSNAATCLPDQVDTSRPRNYDPWERWEKGVIHFPVLALKIISSLAIIAIFAVTEYAAIRNVAKALVDEPVRSVSGSETGCGNECCRKK
jgi:hypothetical protein